MWFISELISVFYLSLYWNRKHGLNCHRMKPALFSVLCEIKEKTGKIFMEKYFHRKRTLELQYTRTYLPPSDLVAGYKEPLPKLINHFSLMSECHTQTFLLSQPELDDFSLFAGAFFPSTLDLSALQLSPSLLWHRTGWGNPVAYALHSWDHTEFMLSNLTTFPMFIKIWRQQHSQSAIVLQVHADSFPINMAN